ncbi:hypothetical protein AX769_12260 [Frondihabitans sp. PAMC 28766]|uniref:HAMP domain-containing sensor histidine kinase n=1 Tax=Frondihabitans sp. PAMC 28766 TaxID=1795630 RepID=UPI00078E82EC|nr:HAMP domain-containing sensor histidine kinase [Frondihabitans sp. PAMC 28766]AMM20772.1 hypothetical protein AX769_12260 [Frondihabitans sp. PAMC 28766]
MRRIGSTPIRVRITLGSLLVAGIVLAGVAILMSHQIRATTASSETTLAQSDIAPYASDLQNNPDETPDKPAAGVLVAIRAQTGAFLLDTLPAGLKKNLNDRDLHDAEFARVPPGEMNSEAPTRRVSSGSTTYIVVEQHLSTSKGEFTLWGARSTASGDLTVHALDHSLGIGLVAALLAFAAAAWVLSSLSLRPVRRLVESAERLGRDDSGGPLPVSPAGDELSRLARTLNAFIARLRASADHERQMVSDASHELRTPLAALTARLELAHRSSGDAEALEAEISAAQLSVARLTDLTTTLLELSRLDESVTPGEPQPTTTAEMLVGELLQSVDRARIAPHSVDVEIEFDVDSVSDGGARYALSPAAFGRIADNLIGNAATFSPEGSLVTVVLRQEPHESDRRLKLTVSDDGPGAPGEFLPVAFDRFTRADDSRRRVQGGTGLGLALVRGLAERAGGTATLLNRPEGGAMAVVEIPAV